MVVNKICKDCALWKLYKDDCFYWWQDKKQCSMKTKEVLNGKP